MLRRELLTASVSALLAPALAASKTGLLPPLGSKPVHSAADFRKAFDEYLAAYRGFHPLPDGPDRDAPYEARCAHDKEMDKLCEDWCDARRRLLEMVLNNHGSTFKEWGSNVAGVAVDIGDLAFVAAPDPDEEGHERSRAHLAIVPRSPEMIALLDGLYVPPEDEPAPQVPLALNDDTPLSRRPYVESVEIDRSRMPEGEPVPLSAQRQNMCSERGHVWLSRTWTKEDALKCNRCHLCPFREFGVDRKEGPTVECTMAILPRDIDRVVHSATPEPGPDDFDGPGVLADTYVQRPDGGKVVRTRVVTATLKAWEGLGLANDPSWVDCYSGRDNVKCGIRIETGPAPRILMA
jgi:hypothetical protein